MRPLTAIGVVLLIAGPWYYAVAVQTDGDFLHAFFVQEHFGRATTAMENHNGNLLFYPLTMMAGLFPWSIFTLPLILMLWKQLKRQNDSATENWTDGYTLSICWIAVWIAAFTLARTKLPSYATPCYPAAALLVGAFLQRWMQQHRDVPAKISRLSFGTLALVGLAVSIALPIAISRFLPGEQWLTIVGLVLLCGGTIAFAFALWRKQEQAVVAMSVTAVLFCLALFVVAAGTISRHREDASVLARISKQTESNPSAVGAYGCMESSWVFYSNAPVHELSQSDHRTEFRERLNNWKPKPKLDVNTFFEQHGDGLVLTRRSDLEKVQQHSLRELRIVDEVSYLMEQDKLVLLHVADHVNLAKASASKLSESGKTR